MSVDIEWPDFGPRLELKFDLTSGVLTLVSPSNLLNPSDFVWGSENQLTAAMYKNGAKAADITINSSTGALSMSAVQAAPGDHFEARFVSAGYAASPWKTTVMVRRSAFFDAPSGNAQITFDATNNPMPVPGWDMAFGWNGGNRLKVGFKVSSSGGATQDMVVSTRKMPAAYETSSTIDLDDTTNVQTHTSSFVKGDVSGEFAIETVLPSATTSTRMEDRILLVFTDKDAVPGYPAGFPTSGVMLTESLNASRLKLAQP